MKIRLYQTLSTRLVLSPRLQQAVSLLQLPNMELLLRIRQELLLNPFLEEVQKEEVIEESQLENTEGEEAFEEFTEGEEYEVRLEDWQDLFQAGNSMPGESGEGAFYEKPIAVKTTLIQHLIWQLHLSRSFPEDRITEGELIIGDIDENGYLRTSLEELANVAQVPIEEMENILRIIQSFEPGGVGARDLKECLLLQINKESDREKLAAKIVENYLEEVRKKDFLKVSKELDVELEEVKKAASFISSLNPNPGSIFDQADVNCYIVPDVIVDKVDNEYVVIINDDSLPRLGINKYYMKLMKNKRKLAGDAREFLEKKFQSASWLLECVEQRRMTLHQVTTAITKKQLAFLEKGVKYLSPLNLKQIAEVVNLHESTVSRAISNKYVQTPRGMFELKFFFPKGFDCVGDEAVSSLRVKEIIKDIINNEDIPLSDEEITILLKEKGINIARRTISKYRDELKIPGLNKRKENRAS